MKPETAKWLLNCAMRDHAQAEQILDTYFNVLPVDKRVELQLAKARLEFVIEETLEKLQAKTKVTA
jgi:hypothetical protein